MQDVVVITRRKFFNCVFRKGVGCAFHGADVSYVLVTVPKTDVPVTSIDPFRGRRTSLLHYSSTCLARLNHFCRPSSAMYHYYALAVLVHLTLAHQHHDNPNPGQHPTLATPDGVQGRWLQKYGKQFDLSFSGPLSFGHIPYQRCLENESALFDIAILGLPFGKPFKAFENPALSIR